jgi:hypothetical protein
MPYTSPLVYAITDCPADKVEVGVLQAAIDAVGLPDNSIDYLDANALANQFHIHFTDTSPDAVSDADKAICDAQVAAHPGYKSSVQLMGSNKLVTDEVAVTEDAAWQTLGGVVTTPGFFGDLSLMFARISQQVKTVGATVEFRIMEDNGASIESKNSTPWVAPDTAGVWTGVAFNTDVPPRDPVAPATENTYTLEARLNGSTSASVRFSTMSVMLTKLIWGVGP